MKFSAFGSHTTLDKHEKGDRLEELISEAVRSFAPGAENMCIVPPDLSRYQSQAGSITKMLWKSFGSSIKNIIPAVGTHHPMNTAGLEKMYRGIPEKLFLPHDFRRDAATLGRIGGSFIEELSEGVLNYDWPVQINSRLSSGACDCIISIGQVVPHEVTGMANHVKNLLIGTGGKEAIDKSHYLGAVYGMERILGKADSPVRRLLNEAASRYLASLPILYILTVIDPKTDEAGGLRGVFMGDSDRCFSEAAALSAAVNIETVDTPLRNCIVSLDEAKYGSFWIGNKGIYRTRKAMAEGGTLWIVAPGLKECGEDGEADRLIRKYGYPGRRRVMELVESNVELQTNLGAAAHLIHGSTEGMFSVRVVSDRMSREVIESLHYEHCSSEEFTGRFPAEELVPGYNDIGETEPVYYIPDPALGLWQIKDEG